MATYEFLVTGMTCGHCETAVRGEVARIPGIQGIEVNATTGFLTITADEIDDRAVIAAVDEAGYEAARL